MRYEKWLGAGLGWAVTGNPIGGLLGFIAGTLIERGNKNEAEKFADGVTEFELNLIVLASHLIKIDGKVSLAEINFLQQFLDTHFDEKLSAKRQQIISHCLNKEYDLDVACNQIRMNTPHATHIQVVRFLFDMALCNGELNERENYFVFRLAGYLNVNDVDFKRLKTEHTEVKVSAYEVLGVKKEMSLEEIRMAYRKSVLKVHPDRNKDVSEEERKKLTAQFQKIQEAYEEIKQERSVK